MTHPPAKVGPRADDGLDPGVAVALDTEFFRGTSPHRYFEARLRMLLAVLGNDEAAAAVEGPLTTDVFAVGQSLQELVTPEFGAVEITNLHHHVAETVLRLLLCLDDAGGIRLALARLRPDQFRDRVRAFLDLEEDGRADQVRSWLRITEQGEAKADRVAATGRVLYAAGFHLLDHAQLYNATKHGFAISADHSEISLGLGSDGDLPLSRAGLWLRSVHRIQREDRACWTVAHTAVDTAHMAALTYLLIAVLGSAWRIGAAVAGVSDDAYLMLPSGEQVGKLLDRPRADISRVRIDLPYPGRDQTITMEVDTLVPRGP